MLRRIAKAADPPQQAPARALRLAMVRAADHAVGLPLSVPDLTEEEGTLDDLLSRMDDGLLLIGLRRDAEPTGLVALDREARAAVVEMQTLGALSQHPAEARPSTSADAALARPLLETFLREAQAALDGSPLGDWLRSPTLGERVASPREAALLLPDGRYRTIRLALELGAGERQGLVLVLARTAEAPVEPDAVAAPTVAPLVLRAQTEVQAILHRLRLPLCEAEELTVGQVLSLPGVTVASVRLESGGVPLGPARLGQVGGMRAVRIETPLSPELAPLPGNPRIAPTTALLPAEPPWPAPDLMDQPGSGVADLPPPDEGVWPAMAGGL